MNPNPTDLDLLRLHASGDRKAFDTLYRRYYPRLMAFARVQGAPDPEDVTQTALAKAALAAGKFAGESSVNTWLHTLVKNLVIDGLRYRSYRPEVAWDEGLHGSTCPDPMLAREYDDLVSTLSPEQREALYMHGVEGYTAVEIGSRTHTNDFTVKSRIRGARRKLRAEMTLDGSPAV